MTSFSLYQKVCSDISKLVTQQYSSSFSRAILLLSPNNRQHIYNVYGFVRLADEIVDSFHDYDRASLLDQFEVDYYNALQSGISINPILHAFVQTQLTFDFPQELPDAFLKSMRMDLGNMESVDTEKYHEYIYGSAEVVGLMSLLIFVNGDKELYNKLKSGAQRYGAALQKVNFLRDISSDYNELNRTYFPNIDFKNFTEEDKKNIEAEIKEDFLAALNSIRKLPLSSRFAVYLSFRYYYNLLRKIQRTPAYKIFNQRIRVNNVEKAVIFSKIYAYKTFKPNLKKLS